MPKMTIALFLVVKITLISIVGCGLQHPAPKQLHLSQAGIVVEGRAVGRLSVEEVKASLLDLAAEKNTFPQNAAFTDQGKIAPDTIGQTLDVAATTDAVMGAWPESQVSAVYQQLHAPISRERLEQAKRISAYETIILDDTPDRVENISLTARLINNTLLEPGQEFSFNSVTGEPTPERGFRKAVILENGQKVQGLGGGMCQVSSTLYNAVLEAGLIVTERHPHSQPVSYVPAGRDATTFTNKDLRFLNSTRQPLVLRVFVAGRKKVMADLWALSAIRR